MAEAPTAEAPTAEAPTAEAPTAEAPTAGEAARGLVPPAEPLELKARLREAAGRDPGGTRLLLGSGEDVGGYLWSSWEAELRESRVSRGDVVGYAGTSWRELWLWVMGERTWNEAASLVGGGILRRSEPR